MPNTFGDTHSNKLSIQLFDLLVIYLKYDFNQIQFYVFQSYKYNSGSKLPNLCQDTDILNIHCDLVTDSLVDGVQTDIIYFFN